MLHLPNTGHKIFEVAVYNRNVRELVKEQRRHAAYDDRWAAPQLRNVVARDEDEARKLIAQRFPPDDGFVIQRVHRSRF
jgi:hypothetical protein